MAITRAGAEVAQLGGELAERGARRLVGDAVTAALLAEGACVAAGRLAAINLSTVPDDPRLAEVSRPGRRRSRRPDTSSGCEAVMTPRGKEMP